ncbi:MAG: hypothetical protein K9M97_03330 [Akkermansiaceae bacterium]|nr:hypothetical protein [Akkermansiaceae bacterium]
MKNNHSNEELITRTIHTKTTPPIPVSEPLNGVLKRPTQKAISWQF